MLLWFGPNAVSEKVSTSKKLYWLTYKNNLSRNESFFVLFAVGKITNSRIISETQG